MTSKNTLYDLAKDFKKSAQAYLAAGDAWHEAQYRAESETARQDAQNQAEHSYALAQNFHAYADRICEVLEGWIEPDKAWLRGWRDGMHDSQTHTATPNPYVKHG